VPTKSVCSAAASSGGQRTTLAGGCIPLAPSDPFGVVVDDSRLERSRLGGVASIMMFVEGVAGENAENGAPPALAVPGCVVEVEDGVLVELVPFGLAVGTGVVVGNGVAPDVASGVVPGGGAGRGVLVGEVVAVEDCAMAGLAVSARIARASAPRPISANASPSPAWACSGARARDRRCRDRGPRRRGRRSRRGSPGSS